MSNKALAKKQAFFEELKLLDVSDSDKDFPDEGLQEASQALMSSPVSKKTIHAFLGPTPPERQAQFEAQAQKERATARAAAAGLIRSKTAPEPVQASSSFPVTKRKGEQSAALDKSRNVPVKFYKRVGDVPRPISKAKKDAVIKLEPESKQYFNGKIIYFFPNDDISAARRQRITKLIQLGAAWVKNWRTDITHVIVDDRSYTYTQLLKHLNMTALPDHIVLVNYDPYVPSTITWRDLQDPTEPRFRVTGAPVSQISSTPSLSSARSLPDSLQTKPSRDDFVPQDSQATRRDVVKDGFSLPEARQDAASPFAEGDTETVKDSFGAPSSPKRSASFLRSGVTEEHDDALSRAIAQTKAIAHLPIEEDSGDVSNQSSPERIESSSDDGSKGRKTHHNNQEKPISKSAITSSRGFNQHAFQCMHPDNADHSDNPNARTIQVLQEMCKYYDQTKDQWRTFAYRKGIATLARQKKKVTTKEEAFALPNIGTRLAEKIEEIVLTNKLRKLDYTRDDPTDQALRLFMGIYGVGLSQASKWIQQGHQTLKDLVETAKLTTSQKIGIEHYEDFAARIPRAEVEAHGEYVRRALQEIDIEFEVTIMGSFRRGAKDCGDIDLIISKRGATFSTLRTVVFDKLVPRLFQEGFLKASLATSHKDDGSKWHGASCLPHSTIWRRLDLLLVPEDEMGAALIYFTGNDIFNRSMRLLASKKGMNLNQRGLYKDVVRGRNREKLNEGTPLEGRDEKKIFEILGVPWRTPEERIC